MSDTLDVLFLLALPASGKSELRRYLASLTRAQRRELHLGDLVQIDDFPYVHFMRRASAELRQRGRAGAFFESEDLPFVDARDWGTLSVLLDEDYADLASGRMVAPHSAAKWLMERLDTARARVGAPRVFSALPKRAVDELADALEEDARDLVAARNDEERPTLEDCTVLVELARGGPEGSRMPLAAPRGYGWSLSLMSRALLDRAGVLYVHVTPEESRRKNQERANPRDPGSILNHGVPLAVMKEDYGCDDLVWLSEVSDEPGTIRIDVHSGAAHLPVEIFENRDDLTSFLRASPASWPPEKVAKLRERLGPALDRLWRKRRGP